MGEEAVDEEGLGRLPRLPPLGRICTFAEWSKVGENDEERNRGSNNSGDLLAGSHLCSCLLEGPRSVVLLDWPGFQTSKGPRSLPSAPALKLSSSLTVSLCLSVSLSLCFSVSLCLCLSVSLSLCISVSLSLCLNVYLSLCL